MSDFAYIKLILILLTPRSGESEVGLASIGISYWLNMGRLPSFPLDLVMDQRGTTWALLDLDKAKNLNMEPAEAVENAMMVITE